MRAPDDLNARRANVQAALERHARRRRMAEALAAEIAAAMERWPGEEYGIRLGSYGQPVVEPLDVCGMDNWGGRFRLGRFRKRPDAGACMRLAAALLQLLDADPSDDAQMLDAQGAVFAAADDIVLCCR